MGTGCISVQGRKRTKYTSNEKNESNEKKNVWYKQGVRDNSESEVTGSWRRNSCDEFLLVSATEWTQILEQVQVGSWHSTEVLNHHDVPHCYGYKLRSNGWAVNKTYQIISIGKKKNKFLFCFLKTSLNLDIPSLL